MSATGFCVGCNFFPPPFGTLSKGPTFQPAFSATAIYTLTASGGTDTFTANALWYGAAGVQLSAGVSEIGGFYKLHVGPPDSATSRNPRLARARTS
jgi:hypothetical protein